MNFLPLVLTLLFVLITNPATASKPSPRFNVEVMGTGKPVLLIPGFLSDQRVWDDIATPLSINYELHRVSIAGFGNTPKADAPSLQKVREELLDYIEANCLSDVVVVGHSLGGFMGMWLATANDKAISAVVTVDGLPFIGPVFTQKSDVTVADLSSQANFLKAFYAGLDSTGMRMSTQRGIHNQTTHEMHQNIVLEMAAMSDPITASDAIYTIMTTDLREQLSSVSARITLLGASGGFTDKVSKQNAEALYKRELSNASTSNIRMNTQSRHFIMYDDPQWLLTQIETALEEAE